jgi:hypothetical protein
MKKFNLFIGIFFIILLVGSTSAYMASKVQGITISTNFSKAVCQEGQDFIIQISPLGCTPAIVRTDLLEENDVPVFCQLSAMKINPLISVDSIDSISFSGTRSPQISGIGFHPAKAALGVKGNLNVPSLNNLGYVVINLKKQTNASAIPDYVSGTLTAKIKYNVDNAFGIGSALFYLPQLTDDDWATKQIQYGFWDGKGYLRADDITNTGATVSLYSNNNLVSTVNLEKGKTSENIYLPGFECRAGLKLKLESLENPDTRAMLRVNSEVVEVAKGEKFLDNKCQITNLQSQGIVQKAGIQCKTDSGVKNLVLTMSPKLILNMDGEDKGVELGDWLYDGEGKSVYLGYVGTEKGSDNQNDLFIFLVSIPQKKSKLSADEISSLNSFVNDLVGEGKKSTGIIDQTSDILKSLGGASSLLSRAIGKGQTFYIINFADKNKNFAGKTVSITGFSGAQNSDISDEVLQNYENAKADYETIIQGYSTESYDGVTTYGEEALYREIILAWTANQKKTALDLCTEFKEAYPNSNKKIVECDSASKLANQEIDSVYITINKDTKKITFDGINEPTFEDYGARVIMTTSDGNKPFNLRKDSVEYLQSSGEDYIQLLSLDDNSATVRISVTAGTTKTQTVKLVKDATNDFAKGYSFTLQEINLQKIAKVSVVPNIQNAGTETNFSFQIGIEKRAFQLPPEKIKETINGLNNTINQWKGISSNLGTVVEGLKTACFVTGAALVLKNLASGTAGIARQEVMRSSNGWNEKCASMVAAGTYSSLDDCFLKNADKIDGDISKLGSIIDLQNSKIKTLEQGYTQQGVLTEQVVDTDSFMQSYSSQVNNYLVSNNIDAALTDPSGKGETLSKDKILSILTSQGYKDRIYTIEQLREIELYANVLNDASASSDLKDLAKQTLYSDLANIQTSNEDYLQIIQMASNLGLPASKVGWINMGEKVKPIEYTGLTLGSVNKNINGYSADTPVYVAPASDGNKYLFILDNSAGTNLPIKRENNIPQIYYYDTGVLVNNPASELTNIYFKKFDSASYKNEYKNPQARYYETDPYKGLPAIVPFDLANGWYSATKPTIAAGGSIASYDASARVSSFYLCNVGENGLEENIGGDDICEMINTGTGQAYNQFPGLSESDAKKLIDNGIKAIEQAKTAGSSTSGKINILGNLILVGSPAVDTPQFQCQDFMSPKECLLIFNLCDPVICPSSRCDLGGSYPVQDVVQTGIIGSIALCLPNFQEGIVMPVCLTGVKAGIDGLLSVQSSYRDCLQESLDTGKMVGICDEVYSIYLCDFIWKQAIPFADMIVPKLMELVAGQNVRGGGEYLGVSSAWTNAESSINYFTNYYGANSKSAFLTRTTQGIQDEVCKVYTSTVVPSGADFLSKLTQPDSPVQFTGRFDEIPFTSVTVPPTSHYKVFYHIYAGKDSGAYYQVYLKGSSTSTYYKDTQQNLMIASGYVAVDDYASETVDKIATTGYKEMCINVNGQEECGFKEVSTDFAINYIKDQYIASEATKAQITTASECISGSANAYTLLNPNVQSGAESLINPEIYNQGIIRYCATDNPGKGTDPYAGTENARYVEVGYCDDEKMKCWLDTQTVENTIKTTTVEGQALDEISKNYIDILSNETNYLTSDQFSAKVQNITKEKDAGNRVSMINEIFDKVFFSNEKSQLLYLRGNAYSELLQILLGQITQTGSITETSTTTQTASNDILSLTDSRARVLAAASKLNGAIITIPQNGFLVCGAAALRLYSYAKVSFKCVYGDKEASYQVYQDYLGHISNNQNTKVTMTVPGKFAPYAGCPLKPISQKFDNIQPGDYLVRIWDSKYNHGVIFLGWEDKNRRIAKLFDWNGDYLNEGEKDSQGNICTKDNFFRAVDCTGGGNNYCTYMGNYFCKTYWTYTSDLSDAAGQPVYMIHSPDISGTNIATTEIAKDISPAPPVSTITMEEAIAGITSDTEEKIYSEAVKLAGTKTISVNFVARSLTNAGLSGIFTAMSISSFADELDKNENFEGANINNLQKGDVILLGKGCNKDYSIGIVSYLSGNTVVFYSSLNDIVKEEKYTLDPNINENLYVVRAYRYVADLTAEEKGYIIPPREKWTIQSALLKISSTPLTGNYNNNKVFIDQLIIDGLLTQTECNSIGRNNILQLGQKDIKWVEGILKSKAGSQAANVSAD